MMRKVALPDMPKGGFDVYLLDKKVINVLMQLDEKNSALTVRFYGVVLRQTRYIIQDCKEKSVRADGRCAKRLNSSRIRYSVSRRCRLP